MLSRAERQAATVVLMLIVGVLLVLVYLLTNDTGRAQSDARIREEQIARGQQLFAANCAVCHGNRGQGGVGLKLDIAANRPTSEAQATDRVLDPHPDERSPRHLYARVGACQWRSA